MFLFAFEIFINLFPESSMKTEEGAACFCRKKKLAFDGFDGAETNCRIAHNLGILLMNSNCFAIFFSGIIAMSVQISISKKLLFGRPCTSGYI